MYFYLCNKYYLHLLFFIISVPISLSTWDYQISLLMLYLYCAHVSVHEGLSNIFAGAFIYIVPISLSTCDNQIYVRNMVFLYWTQDLKGWSGEI